MLRRSSSDTLVLRPRRRRLRILLVDSGHSGSYHAMRSLARRGHRVTMASAERPSWLASRYCHRAVACPPGRDRDAFARFLDGEVQHGRYDLLLTCGDDEAAVVWRHRDQLAAHVDCVLPDPACETIAFSKSAALAHAKSLGLPVPRTVQPTSDLEVERLARDLQLPAVVKGEHGSAGRQVRWASTPAELIAHFRALAAQDPATGPPSIQEYVPGTGYVVHALFADGRPLALCSHRKDREHPPGRGVTSAGTVVDEPALTEAAIRMLDSLRWHGLAMLDFQRDDRDGQFRFLELDARISASIDITRAAGADQVAMLSDLLAGADLRPRLHGRAGVHYVWLAPRDALALLAAPHQVPEAMLRALRGGLHGDLDLADPWTAARALRTTVSQLRYHLRSRELWRERRQLGELRRHARRAPALIVARAG